MTTRGGTQRRSRLPPVALSDQQSTPSRDVTLALTKIDTGGEVFERQDVAAKKAPERPKGRGASDFRPTSSLIVKGAGSESARVGNSPPVSKLRESQHHLARFGAVIEL